MWAPVKELYEQLKFLLLLYPVAVRQVRQSPSGAAGLGQARS